jgi:hypothetical protein
MRPLTAMAIGVIFLVLAPAAVAAPPTVVLSDPTATEEIKGVESFDVNVSNDALRVDYYIDDVLVATDASCCEFSEQVDTTQWPDGSHTIVARAMTDPPPPPPPPPTPGPLPEPGGFVRALWTKAGSTTFGQARSLGFHMVLVNPDRAQLDRAYAAGLRAGVWLGNYDGGACVWNWSDATVTQRITAVRGHPAIAYYFLADEPHAGASGGCSTAPQDLAERNALVKLLDPSVPTFVTENRREDFAAVGRIADVFGPIQYVCRISGGCSVSKIPQTIAAVNAAGITNWWGVVQSFGEPAGGYYRAPTPAELEQILAAWKAAPGIDGLMTYAWGEACCGDDIGLIDLPGLWPTWQTENARR